MIGTKRAKDDRPGAVPGGEEGPGFAPCRYASLRKRTRPENARGPIRRANPVVQVVAHDQLPQRESAKEHPGIERAPGSKAPSVAKSSESPGRSGEDHQAGLVQNVDQEKGCHRSRCHSQQDPVQDGDRCAGRTPPAVCNGFIQLPPAKPNWPSSGDKAEHRGTGNSSYPVSSLWRVTSRSAPVSSSYSPTGITRRPPGASRSISGCGNSPSDASATTIASYGEFGRQLAIHRHA